MNAGRTHMNRVMYQGHQQNFNPKTGEHSRIIVNKGHWGKNVAAGQGDTRNGGFDEMEVQNYATRNTV